MIRKGIRAIGRSVVPSWWNKLSTIRAQLAERRHWDKRIRDVLACPDNARLRRVATAGKIVDGYQVMHNGTKVVVNRYYGDGITRMLVANRGCHEPQEEVVFDAIVRTLPAGAIMIETGAYWGFYSMWFCQSIAGAKVFLIEPAIENLHVGQMNFCVNNYAGDFTHAYVGAESGQHADGTLIVNIESFLAEKGLKHVHFLHADIEGFEVEMLRGMRQVLNAGCIDYLFISTHTMELHSQCVEFLREHGYRILVSVDLEETHSMDGVLVACSALVSPPDFQPPSKKARRCSSP